MKGSLKKMLSGATSQNEWLSVEMNMRRFQAGDTVPLTMGKLTRYRYDRDELTRDELTRGE
jgi:hypothetical protein